MKNQRGLVMKNRLAIILLFFMPFWLIAQSQLEIGIAQLESGNYAEAALSLSEVVEKDAGNKTAKICLARALGLSGQIEEASIIIQKLIEEYGPEKELLLNKAEVRMWAGKFEEANAEFKEIERAFKADFTTLLGLANSYAQLGKPSNALIYIDRALELDFNETAQTSKKFIILALSDSLLKADEPKKAYVHLKQLSVVHKDDATITMALGTACLKLKKWKKAARLYKSIDPSDKYAADASMAASYALSKSLHYKQSLIFARRAVTLTDSTTADKQKDMAERATVNLVYSMLNAGKRKEANSMIQSLMNDQNYPAKLKLALLRTAFNLGTNKDAKAALDAFDEGDGEGALALARAEYLLFKGKQKMALDELANVGPASTFKGQSEALTKRVKDQMRNQVHSSFEQRSDNGGNAAMSMSNTLQLGLFGKLRPEFTYRRLNLGLKGEDMNRGVESYSFGLGFQQSSALRIKLSAGRYKISTEGSGQLIYNASIKSSIGGVHHFALHAGSTIYDYNIALLDQKLTMNNSRFSYQLSAPSNLGLYFQLSRTGYSDNNNSGELYLSTYYNISPVFKAGLDYQRLGFKSERPELYFSPTNYYKYQAFVSYNSTMIEDIQVNFKSELKAGYQKINEQADEFVYSLDLECAYRPFPRMQIALQHSRSTASSLNTVGYAFERTSLSLRLRI